MLPKLVRLLVGESTFVLPFAPRARVLQVQTLQQAVGGRSQAPLAAQPTSAPSPGTRTTPAVDTQQVVAVTVVSNTASITRAESPALLRPIGAVPRLRPITLFTIHGKSAGVVLVGITAGACSIGFHHLRPHARTRIASSLKRPLTFGVNIAITGAICDTSTLIGRN